MDEAEKKLLFGSLATPEPQQVVPAQLAVQPQQPVVTQQTPQPRPPIVTQPTQQAQTPDVATLAQQAASAQQQLNATTPPPVAPSAINSLGNNIGGANFWNVAGALGGILGTAALANQLFSRMSSSVNGQEQVTHGRVEPTMSTTQPQAPANTGFNEPTGQQVSNPVEPTTEEQLVNQRVEEVKAETKKPFSPATSPKATAQDVEMVVKSEANKQAKAQPVKPPKEPKTKVPEGHVFKEGLGPGDNWLYNTHGAEGRRAILNEFNEGNPVGSYEAALELNKKAQAKAIGPVIPREVAKERNIELPETNFGKLGKATKVAGKAGLLLVAADVANAKTPEERRRAQSALGEMFLPISATPTEAGAPVVPSEYFANAAKLGSPYYGTEWAKKEREKSRK